MSKDYGSLEQQFLYSVESSFNKIFHSTTLLDFCLVLLKVMLIKNPPWQFVVRFLWGQVTIPLTHTFEQVQILSYSIWFERLILR